MVCPNFDSMHKGISNAPSPNIIALKVAEIAQFKVYLKPSNFPYGIPLQTQHIFEQVFEKSGNQVHMLEIAIND